VEILNNITFLGLQIDNHLMWKNHIEQTIPTLYAAYYAIRSVVHISNINILKSVYYAYFHSVVRCGKFYRVALPSVARISVYKRNSTELWLLHNPELHIEACGDNWRSACSVAKYIFINELQ